MYIPAFTVLQYLTASLVNVSLCGFQTMTVMFKLASTLLLQSIVVLKTQGFVIYFINCFIFIKIYLSLTHVTAPSNTYENKPF